MRKWDGPLQYEDASKTLMMLPTDLVYASSFTYAPAHTHTISHIYAHTYVNTQALLEDADFKTWVEVYAKDRCVGVGVGVGV